MQAGNEKLEAAKDRKYHVYQAYVEMEGEASPLDAKAERLE